MNATSVSSIGTPRTPLQIKPVQRICFQHCGASWSQNARHSDQQTHSGLTSGPETHSLPASPYFCRPHVDSVHCLHLASAWRCMQARHGSIQRGRELGIMLTQSANCLCRSCSNNLQTVNINSLIFHPTSSPSCAASPLISLSAFLQWSHTRLAGFARFSNILHMWPHVRVPAQHVQYYLVCLISVSNLLMHGNIDTACCSYQSFLKAPAVLQFSKASVHLTVGPCQVMLATLFLSKSVVLQSGWCERCCAWYKAVCRVQAGKVLPCGVLAGCLAGRGTQCCLQAVGAI